MSTVRFTHVTFADCPLPVQAVQMPDGLVGAPLRSLCAALSLDYASQNHRIRRIPALREALQSVTLDTAGGPQAVDVVPAWAIPVWLAGLHINRLPEAKRALILAFQREAVATIERAFTREESHAHAPEPPPPQAPAPEAAQGSLRRVRQKLLLAAEDMTDAAEEIGHFEAEYQVLVERVTALEGGPASSIIGVSPQRLAQIYLFANRLRQRRNWPIAQTLAGQAEHFRVADVYDLPEKDWPAILDWFASLLEEW